MMPLSYLDSSARDLPVPGREADGVHFAMTSMQQNRRNAGENVSDNHEIFATDKHVVVIGGGDTGSDCVGTSFRHGAKSVTQLEIMPQPPARVDKAVTWPNWPLKLRTSSSHEEGAHRDWAITTTEAVVEDGKVTALKTKRSNGKRGKTAKCPWQKKGSEKDIPADLVLLAMGFVHPAHEGMVESFGVELDPRGNVKAETSDYQTSVPGVFTAAICAGGNP